MIQVPLPRTIGVGQMRQVNRSAILELIRLHSPIARSEISRLLELSLPTVIRIVDELIADGLVRPTGETAGNTGRPRELLEYDKNGGLVIGFDLGGVSLYGALANIGGEILEEICQNPGSASGEASYTLLEDMIETLIASASHKDQKLLGLAVGVPGVTHARSGLVEWAPSLNWRDLALRQRLQDHFKLPVVVDNDVNLAVLGEQWFGAGRGVNNLVLLAMGTGLGAGLVIDGVIYRGHHEAAGEVGYFLPGIDAIGRRYEQFGAMENIVSRTGIAERARELLRQTRPAAELGALTAEDVFLAACRGEPWASQIVDETADYLSLVVADISTLLDPELVILSGGVSECTQILIPPILQRIQGLIQHVPRIEVSTLGAKATVMGAISLVLHLTKDYYVVRRLY
jgi:glucokinase